jgi:8-amino-7-oxononanoate synthase
VELFDKCRDFEAGLSAQRRQGMALFYRAVDPVDGRHAVRDGRRLLMFGSNDYLGLTHDPRVKQAAADAVLKHGSSSCGARINNGTTTLHQQLEEKLAEVKGVERVMVFSNGFMAMLGTIATLAGAGDVVFCDQENHASLIDGCRASGAEVRVFRHNDMRHLGRLLAGYGRDQAKLIVVDGVFSQTGRIIDLPEVVRLAGEHGAQVMVDDAHATGVLGARGHGTAEHFGLQGRIDLVGGTFSKALGAMGGFIGSRRDVIEYLQFACRPHMFTAAPPVSIVASVLKVLEILDAEPERRQRMAANAARLQQGLRQAGFNVLESATPITPVIIGAWEGALRMTARLEQEGIFVNPIGPPAVAPNMARLRLTPTAAHTEADLRFAVDTLARVAQEVGVLAPCA